MATLSPKWQLAPVGVLAEVLSWLGFSARLAAATVCRALHAAARSPLSTPARIVVRAPPRPETRRRLPPALWSLARLRTLRIARLICLSTADIAALRSLTNLRYLAATFDVRAVWRFPPALETLELTCAEDVATTVAYADTAADPRSGASAPLTTLRALSLDASMVRYTTGAARWRFDMVGLIDGCDALASFSFTDHLLEAEFRTLGTLPGLRRLDVSTFDVPTPDAVSSAVVAAHGWFATLRALTFSWEHVDVRAAHRMAKEIARMPALETLCVRNYTGESLRDLTLGSGGGGGGFRALTALSVADAPRFATLGGIHHFASTLRSLDVSGTALREAADLGILTGLERLRLDDVRPTIGKNITFPAAPLLSVRRLSIHGSAHWEWTARQTFPNADITPPLTLPRRT